jgi:hypothetical protein
MEIKPLSVQGNGGEEWAGAGCNDELQKLI